MKPHLPLLCLQRLALAAFVVGASTLSAGTITYPDAGPIVQDGVGGFSNEDAPATVFQGGTYTVNGTVTPSAITVEGAEDSVWNNGEDGCITGEGALFKSGAGSLTINLDNTYSGGTTIQEGAVCIGSIGALGTGSVTLTGGYLDMGGLAVANDLVVNGDAKVTGGDAFAGSLTLEGGTLSGDTLYLAQDTVSTLKGGTINNTITGYGKIIVDTEGIVTLAGGNTHHGATIVESGTLVINGNYCWGGALVKEGGHLKINGSTLGTVYIEGGSMETEHGFHMVFGQSLYVQDGTVTGDIETSIYSGFGAMGEVTVNGDLYLSGGSWDLTPDTKLTINGRLVINRRTSLYPWDEYEESDTPYVLATYESLSGNLGSIWFGRRKDTERCPYELKDTGHTLLLYVTNGKQSLYWPGGRGVWREIGDLQWGLRETYTLDRRFHNADTVTFDTHATVTIEGKVAPEAVKVAPGAGASVVFTGEGVIVGETSLVKNGAGTLTLNAVNLYTGGTSIAEGVVKATGESSFGTGVVSLSGGTLDFGGLAVVNDVEATGGSISGAAQYAGQARVGGAVVLDGVFHAAGLSMDGAMVSGGRIQDTPVTVADGTIASALAGGTSVTVTGTAMLTGKLDYTGATQVDGGILVLTRDLTKSDVWVGNGGKLVAMKALKGDITLSSGSLILSDSHCRLSLAAGQSLSLESGAVAGYVVCGSKSTLSSSGRSSVSGDLSFSGGAWSIGEGGALQVGGKLKLIRPTTLDITGCHAQNGTYTFANAAGGVYGAARLSLGDAASEGRKTIQLDTSSKNSISLIISGENTALTWAGGKGVWNVARSFSWLGQSTSAPELFYYGDSVVFDTSAGVSLSGLLAPGAVTVSGAGDVVFSGSGSLVGDAGLLMDGSGTLRLNARNNYTGGTTIAGGRVVASGVASFGLGGISLQGGVLDFAKKAVGNDVTATGGAILNAASYKGVLTIDGSVELSAKTRAGALVVESGTLSGGSVDKTAVLLKGGALDSVVSGASSVTSCGDGEMQLNGANSYTGGTTVAGGTLKVGDASALGKGKVSLQGGTLDLNGLAVRNAISVNKGGSGCITSGSAYAGTVRVNKGGTLTVSESLGGTVVLNGGTLDLSHVSPYLDNVTVSRLVTTARTDIYVGEYTDGGSYTLLTIENTAGFDMSKIRLVGMEVPEDVEAVLELCGNELMMMFWHFIHIDPIPYSMDLESGEVPEESVEEAVAEEEPVVVEEERVVASVPVPQYWELPGAGLYTTMMRAQLDGNRAAFDSIRQLMGTGEPSSADGRYRFAAQATSANVDMKDYRRNGFGGLVMVEEVFSDKAVGGISLNYEHADINPDGAGKYESDDTRVNAHLLVSSKNWHSRSIAGIGIHDYDVNHASVTSHSFNLMEEISRTIAVDDKSVIAPFVRVETGYNVIGSINDGVLSIDKQTAWSTDVTLGARFVKTCDFGSVMLEAGVTKAIGDQGGAIGASLVDDSAIRAALSPSSRNRWSATLGGSVQVPMGERSVLNAGATLRFHGGTTEVNANVGYSIKF